MAQLFIFVPGKFSKTIFINSSVLKKKILNIFKYTAFTALGVLLFWLVYRGQDFTQIWETLKNDVNYWWVALALFLGLLSHISRTLRWKIALEPLGEKPRTTNTFIAVMVSYFMNLLLPRMGEFVRCALLSKYERIPFPKLFGTVVTERLVDMLVLMGLAFTVVLLEMGKVIGFANQNPEIVANLKKIATSPYLWIAAVAGITAFVLYMRHSKRKGVKNKIEELLDGFIEGIKSILKMKRYKAYIFHSLFIWLMYFLMLYAMFFSFDFTRNLGPVAALTTFVFSSFGMVAPVQGGIGAWHFMAEKALELYGVEATNGKIFALLAHSAPNIMIIILGVLCIIALPIINRNYLVSKPSPEVTDKKETTSK